MQVNSDNSRAMSVLTFLLFKFQECTANKDCQTLSQPKPWCNDSGALNLHHGYYTMIMTSRRLFRHNPVSHCKSTNQKIRIRTVYEIWIISNITAAVHYFGFCPGVRVYKGITIVLSLFRSHWLAVVYCLVLYSGSWEPVHEDRTLFCSVAITCTFSPVGGFN